MRRDASVWLPRAETALAAIALAIFVFGASVEILLAPFVTSYLVDHLDVSETASIPADEVRELAEGVRRFVTDADAPPLPAAHGGAEPFSAKAVSHLLDVRRVIVGSRIAMGLAAAGVAVWLVFGLMRGRRSALARGVKAGGWTAIGAVAAGAAAGLLDFDDLFAGLHGIFFDEGTWLFEPTDLLVRLFPIPFWVCCTVALAILAVTGGLLLLAAGARLERSTKSGGGVAREKPQESP
jgi:integral membrane protein (TIGR01906 family)